MQINRMLETILILLYRKKVTAKELSERFKVSRRTVYRDIDSLSLSGIPIYSVKGKNGGIFLDDSFTINQALLNNEQQEELIMGLNILKSLGILETDQLMKKFEAVFDLKDWLEINLPSTLPTENDTFGLLKQAIVLARQITFIFYSKVGQTMLVTAQPLKIIFRRQAWYLLAYVPEQKMHQLFRLDSLKSVNLLEESFQPNFPQAIEPLFDYFKVSVQFSKRIGYNMYDRFLSHDIQLNPDRSYTITFEFSTIEEIYSFLLPFGKNAKILEPQWVKEEICQHAASFLKNNL